MFEEGHFRLEFIFAPNVRECGAHEKRLYGKNGIICILLWKSETHYALRIRIELGLEYIFTGVWVELSRILSRISPPSFSQHVGRGEFLFSAEGNKLSPFYCRETDSIRFDLQMIDSMYKQDAEVNIN